MHRSDDYKSLIDLINKTSYRHSTWQVFSDFVEMSAIAISNSVDWIHREDREKRYLEIINSYEKREQELFPEMFAHLINALEFEVITDGPTDILGQVFHELELHNKWKGQFFTPMNICEAMGMMVVGDKEQLIQEKGFITVNEPCAGSGAMVLGLAKAMKANKMNYCSQMVVTATDIDLKCVHMAYLQLALCGIPAVIIHGNTLTVKEWSRWYTPVYMLDGWIWRQHCGMTTVRTTDDERTKKSMDSNYSTNRELSGYEKNATNIEKAKTELVQFVIEGIEAVAESQDLTKIKKVKNTKKDSNIEQISIFDINF
ncbi:N-6 DNA methylase [uncultured Tissierella sp.]|uniref:N-6 DNA methylase n=1 Tax=uncultured Tissierella sp. TaxID=448160 RepID=UPI0028058FA5|nr:N-6 DNA methylase [uncultured Tissierella sp.]MDU5080269.1 N-6 DNA methylase [Bacillota bacterium]